MVKVAVAAASSELAREVIDELLATGKHEILGLGRKDPSHYPSLPGVEWKKTSYADKTELIELLRGTHTLLSFVDVTPDLEGNDQKRLLDAAIEAGVKRFAPSEWSMGDELPNLLDAFPWYAGKVAMRNYLKVLNSSKKVIEYTLFQPGIFMEYLEYPKKTTNHVSVMPSHVMIQDKRIIALNGHLNDPITFTSCKDIARVVAAAVDYEGDWPTRGGITGDTISLAQIQQIGESLTGEMFKIDLLQVDDLDAGVANLQNPPAMAHHSIPVEKRMEFAQAAIKGLLLTCRGGGWTVADDWNRLLPDLKMKTVRDVCKQLLTETD